MMSGQENSRRDALMRQASSAGYSKEDLRQSEIQRNIAATPGARRRWIALVAVLIVLVAVALVAFILLTQSAPR